MVKPDDVDHTIMYISGYLVSHTRIHYTCIYLNGKKCCCANFFFFGFCFLLFKKKVHYHKYFTFFLAVYYLCLNWSKIDLKIIFKSNNFQFPMKSIYIYQDYWSNKNNNNKIIQMWYWWYYWSKVNYYRYM